MRTTLWIALAVFVLIYAVYAIATVDRRSDEAQILSLVEDSAAAVQEHNLGGAVAGVSKNYEDDAGLNYDRLRLLAAQALRENLKYSVDARPGKLKIEGNKAVLNVKAKLTQHGGGILYDRNITLHLEKENGRHALLIPVKVWRVVKTENLGANMVENW